MGVDINQCVLEGRLGADPEEKILGSGTIVVNARIAVSDDYQDRSHQWVSRTYWISVRAYSFAGKQLLLFRKGEKIIIQGKWTVEEYTGRDGKKQHYNRLDIHAVRGVEIRRAERPAAEPQQSGDTRQRAANTEQKREPGPPAGGSADFDDDIPF